MTTRTIGAIQVSDIEQFEPLLERLDGDERVGAITTRVENNCIQIKIGVGLDVELDHKFSKFEDILNDYTDVACKGVVIGSNDTQNYGMAKCYNVGDNSITQVDEYEESPDDGERYWGEKAAAIMFAKYDINANTYMFAPNAEEYES